MPAARQTSSDPAVPTAAPIGRPRLGRLPQRADFLRLQSAGRRQVTAAFILQAAERTTQATAHPRVGFTVTKKIGNAVVRNRVRRRLRALAREVLVPTARCDLDYVLIGRQDALRRDYTKMADDLRKALRRLNAERLPAEEPT